MPEQVQDFYPTPGTLATCMWYTGLDPRTMKPVFVPKTPHDKALQRALMQLRKPQNRKLVLEALQKTDRQDLIGYGKRCLVRPDKGQTPHSPKPSKEQQKNTGKRKPVQSSDRSQEKNRLSTKRKAGWAKAKPPVTKGTKKKKGR